MSNYQVVIKNARCSFPHLAEPSASVANGKKRYRLSALLDPSTQYGKDALRDIEKVIEALKQDTWKEKADRIRLKEDRICYGTGEEKGMNADGEVYQGYEGMHVVVAAADRQPQMVLRDKTRVTDLEDIEDEFYGGCYVDVVVRFYAVTDADRGGNGIFASLEAIRKRKDGERFGAAGVNIDDVFGDDDDDDDMI